MSIKTKSGQYQLSDRYDANSGRVFMTGTQALTRIMLDQARRDRQAGHNTAGYISGYRGSPLGGFDLDLWKNSQRLDDNRITFMPAINEDLGAALVLGAQQAVLEEDCEVSGIFSMWYGKGPGVDRSGDALRHGNAFGTSPLGGVLAVTGDDHGCVSSSMPHQSDVALMSWFMPMLNPASIGEYLEFGEYGFALSRFTGTWVGFKAISETVESGRSVDLKPDRKFVLPDFAPPEGGLHIRKADLPSPLIEERMGAKLKAIEAFVEHNPIDHSIYHVDEAIFGFVTTGKGHLDLMEALRLLGLNRNKCISLGIDIYKVGMVWPLARRDALDFVRGKMEVLVVEEKRGIIESQFKEYFYDWPGSKPDKMTGKYDSMNNPLIPWTGELSPSLLLPIVAARLDRFFPEENLPKKAKQILASIKPVEAFQGSSRTPYFCSGCPHNTSTKVPEGSVAGSGIGCHVMASWMDRNTQGYAQMGGEGVPWIVGSKFSGGKHRFQNLGEGTWYHSGSLAIRQAMAAKANITYKILFNEAVAMTGGQPVDGPLAVSNIVHSCRAEGVKHIALVSDEPQKYDLSLFPADIKIHHRSELMSVQNEFKTISGVSVLIYDQACATEKRRKRKRGEYRDPKRLPYINHMVCEACGDCSVQSNCLSIEPRNTQLGRKRKINLSSCNKDFSCINGFCPSFVTVENAVRLKKEEVDPRISQMTKNLPEPEIKSTAEPFDLLVTGVGGTGVVTIGALITMAAHLEGKGTSVLDFTGFAQKFGSVLSYIRIADDIDSLNQVRIDKASADALIGCDTVVSSSEKALEHLKDETGIVLNSASMPTGDLVLHRDARLDVDQRLDLIGESFGGRVPASINANELSEQILGDTIFANVMMLGFAWQNALVPLSLEALDQAIVLNGVAVEKNRAAFEIGRLLATDDKALDELLQPEPLADPDFSQLTRQHMDYLTEYQNKAYAQRYYRSLERFRLAISGRMQDQRIKPEQIEETLKITARSLFKLMAYKDEYEVARLLVHRDFEDELNRQFENGFHLNYHLAPPIIPLGKDSDGRPRKISFGPWMGKAMKIMASMKSIRGTWLDLFSYTHERRQEVALINWYEEILEKLPTLVKNANLETCNQILSAAQDMRGFGPVKQASVVATRHKVGLLMDRLAKKDRQDDQLELT